MIYYTQKDLEDAKFNLETARKFLRVLTVYKDERLKNDRMIKSQEARIAELENLVKRISGHLNAQMKRGK